MSLQFGGQWGSGLPYDLISFKELRLVVVVFFFNLFAFYLFWSDDFQASFRSDQKPEVSSSHFFFKLLYSIPFWRQTVLQVLVHPCRGSLLFKNL